MCLQKWIFKNICNTWYNPLRELQMYTFLCIFLFCVQLKIIKTFLYFISFISYIIWIYHVYIRANVHVCCYLLYSQKTAILTKHINVHVYFLFLLCSSDFVCEAIIVGISWSHYCLNIAKAQVLRYYDTIALATSTPPPWYPVKNPPSVIYP